MGHRCLAPGRAAAWVGPVHPGLAVVGHVRPLSCALRTIPEALSSPCCRWRGHRNGVAAIAGWPSSQEERSEPSPLALPPPSGSRQH
jgi:hypothetical protein